MCASGSGYQTNEMTACLVGEQAITETKAILLMLLPQ